MNRFVLLAVGALALAACSKPAPSDDAAAAPTPAAPAAPAPAANGPAQPPSFDCAKATGDAEKWVCTDAELSRLDVQLAERYKAAQASPDELDIAAEQRGWIKGRDACMRAVDPRRCLVEAYKTRLVELSIGVGGVPAPATVRYQCDDDSKPLSVVFYNDIDPAAALVRLGSDQAIVFPVATTPEAHDGGRWGREGVDLATHAGQTTLDFYGTTLHCQAAP